MANIVDARGFWTNEAPASYKYTSFGTAAGTLQLSAIPALIHSIVIFNRAASGSFILYDSAGTSGTVIGTYTIGTSTSADPPPPIILDAQCLNALTIANSANLAGVYLSLP